jgi:hypothetical protein
LTCCADARGVLAPDPPHVKSALLKALHRGMTREEFYRVARRLHVTPSNPDYVRFAPGGGPPIDEGSFPNPNAAHPHPEVSIFLHKAAVGCAIPTDQVTVYFNQRDQVAKWTVRSYRTGGCP